MPRKISRDARRDAVIALRVTPAEFDHIRTLADEQQLSVSNLLYRWTRERLGTEEIPEASPNIDDSWLRLARADE